VENYQLVVQNRVSGPNLVEIFTATRSLQYLHGGADQKNVTIFTEMRVVITQQPRGGAT
jgi:hypothetical protein